MRAMYSSALDELVEQMVASITTKLRNGERMCLALKLGKPSRQCQETFKPNRNRKDHQVCCRACYQRLMRLPGFIRRATR